MFLPFSRFRFLRAFATSPFRFLSPFSRRREPFPFGDRVERVGGEIARGVAGAARPPDFHALHTGRRAEAEVDAGIAGGGIAGTGANFRSLAEAAGGHRDPGVPAVAVTLRAGGPEGNPMAAGDAVHEKLRRA